jgi:quinoprotein glucose dehydrogenase
VKDLQVADLRRKTRVRRAAQQPVELFDLAALALPADPRPLSDVPLPGAVEEEEPAPVLGGVLQIERLDAGARPVEERRVPASDIPGEQAAVTQAFTVTTPPLSPHQLAASDAWGITDSDRLACRATFESLRNEGIFTPPSTRGTLVLPANVGGAHWGGVAVDPVRQVAVVPVNRVAAIVQLIPRADFDRERSRAEDGRLGHDAEYNMMIGTPYVMRRRVLLSPTGLPCSPPPWGTLVAVDLGTGLIRWETPLGSMTRPFPAEMADHFKSEWGSPNLGGPIATAGGVVFVGAAIDRWLHAYDIDTGRELWRGPLPEGGKATPMSYRLPSGEQFVVIAVGGGDVWGAGDYVVAFRLPSAR